MCVREYIPDLIQGASTILASIIVVVAGVNGFFRQKEYELVQKRYLEEGVDVVVAITESAMNTYYHNWSSCLENLKTFRDDGTMSLDVFRAGTLPLPPDTFGLTANYRLHRIVGSGVFWEVFQLVISFAQAACTKIRDEIPTGLKITLEKGGHNRVEMVEAAIDALMGLDDEFQRFHFFIGKLQDIAMVLEERKFALKDVKKLKTDKTVITAIKELKDHYKAELESASVGVDMAGGNTHAR